MKFKNFFRGPIFWIVLAVAALLVILPSVFNSSGARVDTNIGLELLESDQVEQAKIYDGEQRVDLTLREDYEELGRSVSFFFSAARAEDVVDAINSSDVDGFTDQPVQNNWLLSLLGFMIPFLLIALVFWFLMSRMQGGGGKVKLRSQIWFDNPDDPHMSAMYIERYMNYGLSREELQQTFKGALQSGLSKLEREMIAAGHLPVEHGVEVTPPPFGVVQKQVAVNDAARKRTTLRGNAGEVLLKALCRARAGLGSARCIDRFGFGVEELDEALVARRVGGELEPLLAHRPKELDDPLGEQLLRLDATGAGGALAILDLEVVAAEEPMQLADVAHLGAPGVGAPDALRIGDHAHHQAPDLVWPREDWDRVVGALAHLRGAIGAEHQRRQQSVLGGNAAQLRSRLGCGGFSATLMLRCVSKGKCELSLPSQCSDRSWKNPDLSHIR